MPSFGNDVFFASIAEIQAGIRSKQFSCAELTRAFCDRLERLGPRYNALALSLRDSAVRKARDIDGDFRRERIRSPLQGVPYAVKDLISVAGQPTTWGAKPYASQVFDQDAAVVKRLSKAGAILIGKLSMVELAGGGGYRFANASLQGPGINPWDPSRWSGGSSSGSGSAVAAGLVPYALGSETSGSILTPSAYCGITGLRPTYGFVNRAGCMPLSWTLDKIGPMAHSAEDCALILEAISGGGGNDDPGASGKRFYYTPQFAPKLTELKFGYNPSSFTDGVVESARPAFAQALDAVRSLGLKLVESKLPDFPFGPMVSTIISAEMGSVFEDLVASGKVDELADKRQIAGVKVSQQVLARDYLRAMRVRRLVQQEFAKLFWDVDIWLSPSLSTPATRLDEPLDNPAIPSTPMIPAGNLAGIPALSLPCGFANNLPLGLAFAGPPYSENKLVAAGKAFQSATDWHKRRPPV
ncbi:MAG: Glutamyl-tRNA(Gln) amidotransferase subunit A [Bryobacteraceae bacterium]|nr:Glutamyl-tRNA(Gln) amidotransferase subunit A [Bryobacteraceae bacterium]